MYEWIAPSGVRVSSCAPPVEPRWWDHMLLHPIWSYTSWITMIFQDYGWQAPRRWFNRHWQRRAWDKQVTYNSLLAEMESKKTA